ncbi:uncharacterized protein ColSpa_06700 [Colletotrichum spaethianum]|uniref:Uncharacterized protein n=1 Tax=Colletotrichum spaethianum TaxID=700344 RepID=A0AA37P7Z7_9PEZI|nr:uncharacterized protein ColSpa_06700 [Colletotrichum spaethianum]GKT46519.1 hypothetical protein ColSpa_06700 [Colletotrichum spaethianum]
MSGGTDVKQRGLAMAIVDGGCGGSPILPVQGEERRGVLETQAIALGETGSRTNHDPRVARG